MTYDLRRLRTHGPIARIPRTRRYQITDTGLGYALLFTHAHDHLLRTGLAEITDPDPPARRGCGPPAAPTNTPSTTSPATPTSQPETHQRLTRHHHN